MTLDEERPLSAIRLIMVVGALLLFTSLWVNVWVVQQAPGQRAFFNPWAEGNRHYTAWTPLEVEKTFYQAAGYDISWLGNRPFQTLRAFLGPYAPIFEMFALRLWGLSTILPFVFLSGVFGFLEGMRTFRDKQVQLGNISATRYRIFAFLGVFSFALAFIFITLPFGSELPVIGTIPLTVDCFGATVWTTSPLLWRWPFILLVFPVTHQITANLAREV